MFTRAIATLALATLAGTATAANVTWNVNGPTTQWNNAQNWIGGHVPNANDFVIIPAGGSPQITGGTVFISGMFIQPGGNLYVFNSLYVEGGASIQGNMSVVGGRFLHRDDINLEGQLMLWTGASVHRRSGGTGVLTVRPAGSILIRSDNTSAVTLATALNVQGALENQSNQPLMIGQVGADASSGVYLAIDTSGVLHFSRSCSVQATTYAGQSAPYIVNAGQILVDGSASNVVDMAANLPLFNGGLVNVDAPDLHVRSSLDFALDGTLTRGEWACQNVGRIFFDNNTLNSVGAAATIHIYNPGSQMLQLSQAATNYGRIDINYGAGVSLNPLGLSFTNHGIIQLSDTSVLNAGAQFANAADGVINCWIGGTADNAHSSIYCSSANLAGTLNAQIAGFYSPANGDHPTLVHAASSINGQFTTVNTLYTSVAAAMSYNLLTADLVFGPPAPPCPGDIGSQGGLPGADGTRDNNDFVVFIDYFFNHNTQADVGSQGGVAGPDGQWDNNDFVEFINEFFAPC
jgi:phage baseplate assembly protein gpV